MIHVYNKQRDFPCHMIDLKGIPVWFWEVAVIMQYLGFKKLNQSQTEYKS